LKMGLSKVGHQFPPGPTGELTPGRLRTQSMLKKIAGDVASGKSSLKL